MMNVKTLSLLSTTTIMLTALAGCSVFEKGEAKYPTGYDRSVTGDDNIYEEPDSIFGEGGLKIFGGEEKKKTGGMIGVNSYLWRAALDTVSFMPLSSVDPFGGVIITDWYIAENAPNERLKLNVFILSEDLKADGIRVRVFRELRTEHGWVNAKVSDATGRKLEDAVLMRARQIRIAEGE